MSTSTSFGLKKSSVRSLTTTIDRKPERWIPKTYQKKAIKFLLEHGGGGLFLDPGLGKTSITYAAYTILKSEKIVKRMLVIAPLRPAQLVWPAEAAKWEQFSKLKVVVLHGKEKDKELLKQGVADVYVINPEGLEWLANQEAILAKKFFDILCVDESSKFKRTSTKRYKLLKEMLDFFRRRWILTGSPAPRGLLDLFGQMYIIDQGRTLGYFITQYRSNYFAPSGYGGYQWVPTNGSDKEIYKRISPWVLRMSEKDYLKLPPMTISNIIVELPPKARKLYDAMEQDLFIRLEEGTITAANAAVATMKCRQIANGGLYLDLEGEDDVKQRKEIVIHHAKLDATIDTLNELGKQPTLIAYEFGHDLHRLLGVEELEETPYFGGGVSHGRAKEIEAMWNQGSLDNLLVQPQSAALGLNLQFGGRALIFHSLTYSWDDYDQLIRRIYRQGQKSRVFVYRIIAKNTVDEAILAVLDMRRRAQNALFDALQAYRSRRRDVVSSRLTKRELQSLFKA